MNEVPHQDFIYLVTLAPSQQAARTIAQGYTLPDLPEYTCVKLVHV